MEAETRTRWQKPDLEILEVVSRTDGLPGDVAGADGNFSVMKNCNLGNSWSAR